jgi:hypothetical protein
VEQIIILFDREGRLNVFRTWEEAVGWTEAIDVAQGEYEGWTVDGRMLELDVVDDDRITVAPTTRHDPTTLLAQLRQSPEVESLGITGDSPLAIAEQYLRFSDTESPEEGPRLGSLLRQAWRVLSGRRP